jgi:hydrogenase maturation protease
MSTPNILVYGYGNPGRADDALGIFFSEEVEKFAATRGLTNVVCETSYQLNVEDALEISTYDIVLFADASMENIETFDFRKLNPNKTIHFSTHAMNPESILALCKDLYEVQPKCYLVSIRGYEWDLGKSMTEKANQNLNSALQLVFSMLEDPRKF